MFAPVGARAVGVSLSLVAGYVAAFTLMHLLVGASATILAVLPPVLGAAILGLRWGLALSAITFAVTVGLWTAFGDEAGTPVLRVGGGIGAVVVGVMAAAIGHLRDLNRSMVMRLREHERLVAQVKASEAKLGASTADRPLVILMFDAEGRIWRCDGPGLASLGLGPSSFAGRAVVDLCPDESDRAAVRRALEGHSGSGRAMLGDRPHDLSYFPTRDDAGTITGGVGVAVLT